MSLSTCEKCGGHIPLGPDASNRCETCGEHVMGDPCQPEPAAAEVTDDLVQLVLDRYRTRLVSNHGNMNDAMRAALTAAEQAQSLRVKNEHAFIMQREAEAKLKRAVELLRALIDRTDFWDHHKSLPGEYDSCVDFLSELDKEAP